MDEDSISFGRMADRRDGPTLRDVFDASYRKLVVQLYGVTGSFEEAEASVQAAFVRAAASERRFLGADDPEAWLTAAAVKAHRRRRHRAPPGRGASPHGRDASPSQPGGEERGQQPGTVDPGFDGLVRRGMRRRTRRNRLAAAAYGLAVMAGASALAANDVSPPQSPSTHSVRSTSLQEVEEVGDRIPPGRAGMPALVAGAPVTVSVDIPENGHWREDPTGAGIYAATRRGAASLHLASFLVDGVVRRPCRTPHVPASPGIPAEFVRPGVSTTALADAIAALPRADAVVSPHLVGKWGTTAVHVRLRVARAACRSGGALWTFDTRRGGELLSNDHARLDYWVVDIRGHAVVIEAELPIGATTTERRALTGLLGSIELHTEAEP